MGQETEAASCRSKGAAAVILAAGKGVRMKSDKAKVLHEVAGRPMVAWVCSAASAAGCNPVVAVVGYQRDKVEAALPSGVRVAVQEEQLGTGHAVMCSRGAISDMDDYVVVLCGDVPLIKPSTIRTLSRSTCEAGASCTVLTVEVDREHTYGRIVRDDSGEVARIVEHKDATEAELSISEVNTGTYCFKAGDLFEQLDNLGNDNSQSEYYLTDVIGMLIESGRRVVARTAGDPVEVMGVDSPEALESARAASSSGASGMAARED